MSYTVYRCDVVNECIARSPGQTTLSSAYLDTMCSSSPHVKSRQLKYFIAEDVNVGVSKKNQKGKN